MTKSIWLLINGFCIGVCAILIFALPGILKTFPLVALISGVISSTIALVEEYNKVENGKEKNA
jgi:hypothetical protein